MRKIVYDCEIIKCIPQKGAHFTGWDYCKGWNDFANMGISVIGAYDFKEKSFATFLHPDSPELTTDLGIQIDSTISDFQEFVDGADEIIGFNSKSFDDKLCAANGINITTTFDLLEQVRIRAYGSPRWEDCPKGHTYALGALGEANGFPKTGSGELAPQLWQQGRHREVIRYCLNDVKITAEMYKLFLAGKLRDPNTGKFL